MSRILTVEEMNKWLDAFNTPWNYEVFNSHSELIRQLEIATRALQLIAQGTDCLKVASKALEQMADEDKKEK